MKWKVLLFDRDALPVWGAEVEHDRPPQTVYLPLVAFGACTSRTYDRVAESADDDAVLHFVETSEG